MQTYLIAAAAGVVLALAAFFGVKLYGHHEYAAGVAYANLQAQAAEAKLSEQYRQQEQTMQAAADKAQESYETQIQQTQAHAADLDAAASRLREQLASLQRALTTKDTSPGAQPHATPGSAIVTIASECAERYNAVVKYAASLADQVTGLQAYVRAVGESTALSPLSEGDTHHR